MTGNKRFTSWGNRIKRNGKLLNIEFKTKTDAKLCCKLCNQMDKHQQEYIDELNEIFKWYKDYYGETILDTRMGWNDDNKILKLEKENEQLKQDRNEMFIRERDAQNELRNIKKENEQLKQSNQEAIELIYDGIVEMHDGKRDYAETLFNKAIKVIKNDT